MIQRKRMPGYWAKWSELTAMFGNMCFYCGEEIATSIDHVLPHSYVVDDSIENLRPSCALCNSLASDKMFDDVYAKRSYILGKRQHRRQLRRCTCSECGVPYIYRTHGKSLFVCPECYDLDWGTDYHTRNVWKAWLDLLETAEILIEVHRLAGDIFRDHGLRGGLMPCLIEAMQTLAKREGASVAIKCGMACRVSA